MSSTSCEELRLTNATIVREYQSSAFCSDMPSYRQGSLIIVLVVGVVSSLALVAVIVHGFRLIHKPKRPRIKKTFVVRKQARLNSTSDTPLTNRPLATEQCEITIENCCNMNICETVCYPIIIIVIVATNVITLYSPVLILNLWSNSSQDAIKSRLALRRIKRY